MKTRTTIIVISIIIILAVVGVVWAKAHKAQAPVIPPNPVSTVTYSCDADQTIAAAYYQGEAKQISPDQPPVPGGSVKLILSDGRVMTLAQTVSGSGIRYANSDETVVFWSKGTTAYITEHDQQTYSNCHDLNSPTSPTSPIGTTTPISVTNWKTYSNSETGISFKYPTTFGSGSYKANLNNDPKVIIATSSETIDTSGCYKITENPGPQKDTVTTINGIKFCRGESGDVGAGQLYTDYYYTTLRNNSYITIGYTIHTSNGCGMYDGDTEKGCEAFGADYTNQVIKPLEQSLSTLTFAK